MLEIHCSRMLDVKKIAFAIDISGSMLVASSFGGTRIEVVKEHLTTALQSMEDSQALALGW